MSRVTVYVEPLQPDPVLYAALADDRAETPYNQLTCVDCGKARRPRRTSLADYPGTVATHGVGQCWGCWQQLPVEKVRYTHCVVEGCGIPLRSKKTLLADAPGTRAHGANGMCSTCYRKRPR